MKQTGKRKRVLAISSGGGHWVQLLRLQPAFEGTDVTYATVLPSSRSDIEGEFVAFGQIPDATRWDKFKLPLLAWKLFVIILKSRPNVIITTGAAPGFLALVIGRFMGCRTCWIDSIANVEELSLSGRKAKRWSTLWLTQWEHLATSEGPRYIGNVIADTEDANGSADAPEGTER